VKKLSLRRLKLPESLVFDLERIERRRKLTKLPAGFSSGPLQKVVAN
jgi:hypothetical protein